MAERGLDYEMVFQTILGFKNLSNAEMRRDHFQLCFQLLNFSVEQERFERFFTSFTTQDADSINVAEFLKEAKKLQHGKQAENNQQKLKQAVERSMRRYYQADRYQQLRDIEYHISSVISDEGMTDFGSLLKG